MMNNNQIQNRTQDRGFGTLAAGAAAGWSVNKATGRKHGNFKSAASGAILAHVGERVGNIISDRLDNNNNNSNHNQSGI